MMRQSATHGLDWQSPGKRARQNGVSLAHLIGICRWPQIPPIARVQGRASGPQPAEAGFGTSDRASLAEVGGEARGAKRPVAPPPPLRPPPGRKDPEVSEAQPPSPTPPPPESAEADDCTERLIKQAKMAAESHHRHDDLRTKAACEMDAVRLITETIGEAARWYVDLVPNTRSSIPGARQSPSIL